MSNLDLLAPPKLRKLSDRENALPYQISRGCESKIRVNSVSPAFIGPPDGYMWRRQVWHRSVRFMDQQLGSRLSLSLSLSRSLALSLSLCLSLSLSLSLSRSLSLFLTTFEYFAEPLEPSAARLPSQPITSSSHCRASLPMTCPVVGRGPITGAEQSDRGTRRVLLGRPKRGSSLWHGWPTKRDPTLHGFACLRTR